MKKVRNIKPLKLKKFFWNFVDVITLVFSIIFSIFALFGSFPYSLINKEVFLYGGVWGFSLLWLSNSLLNLISFFYSFIQHNKSSINKESIK